MAIDNFTGQNIQDTYQRVVQTDNTNRLADGEGNIFIPISASHAITASHAISASHEITFELSSSHAQTASALTPGIDINISNADINGDVTLGSLNNGNAFQAFGASDNTNISLPLSTNASPPCPTAETL